MSASNLWGEDGKGAESSNSVAQMVADAANSFIENEMLPGFRYVPEQDMWYNAATGYFFDMKSSLYYHPSTGWLVYNVLTNAYEVYEDKQKTKWKKKSRKFTAERLLGEDNVKAMDQDNVDVCEVLFDLVDRTSFLSGDESQSRKFAELGQHYYDELSDYVKPERSRRRNSESDESEDDDEWTRRRVEEREGKHPPAVRLIDKTDMNKLYIVTINGATIGYDPDKCDIPLKITDAIAEEHVKISFVDDKKDRHYTIECLRKRFCAYLDNRKITTKKSERLEHGSQLVIGPYCLEVHIHNGSNTCSACEPGILNAKLKESNEVIERLSFKQRRINHRQAMNSIKTKLKLDEADDDDTPRAVYQDRAAKRRKMIGSEPGVSRNYPNIYDSCNARPVPGASTDSVQIKSKAAVVNPGLINPENKGFKLLKSMGWNENTGLGKSNQGIVAPIQSAMKNDRIGLGSNQNQPQVSVPMKEKKRLELMEKTRQRFDQAELEKRT